MKKEEIETDEKRVELFHKYLSQSKRMIHFESLIQIVNNTWKNFGLVKSSHGLTLKNELILSMIEKHFPWEKILLENTIELTEEVKHRS